MRIRAARLTVAVFVLSLARGQTPDRVLTFTKSNITQEFEEVCNLIRNVAEVQGSVDAVQKTLSISGAPDNVGAAVWLFYQLDMPDAAAVSPEYRMAGSSDEIVRVFRVANIKTLTGLQGIVNIAFAFLKPKHMYPLNSQNIMVARGSTSRITAAEWLIRKLDRPTGRPPDSKFQHYRIPDGGDKWGDTLAVLFLNSGETPAQFQEMVNAIRSVFDITWLLPYSERGALALRATEAQIAATEWLVQEIDKPNSTTGAPAEPAVSAYRLPSGSYWAAGYYLKGDETVRVFRFAHASSFQQTQAIVNSVRAATRIARMFLVSDRRLIVFRGTESQVSEAERLITKLDVPSIPNPPRND